MIGNRIKLYRLKKQLSLSELAERAGITQSYLSSIERNLQSTTSIQFLKKISSVLNIPVNTLLSDDEKTPNQDKEPDSDWAKLVREAMNSGVSKEEFREFLECNKSKMNQ